MSKVTITSVFDTSGYGYAAKCTTTALIKAGLDISTNIISTPMSRYEFSRDEMLKEIMQRSNKGNAKINIAITIPSLSHYAFQKNTYNILNMFWESDRICDDWINIINNGPCNEVWVPCQSNYNALMNSGVKKPVHIIPQYTPVELMSKQQAKEILPIPNEGTYRFYSIFQWTKRKNPEALFRAYFNEFSADDNVMLVVKTYGPSAFSNRRWIKEAIIDMKQKSGSTAPVYLFGELMTPQQINAIHPQCHCYVYAGRSEGWNIPLVEAMAYGKQIITSKTGGIADWINDDNGYIIPHELIPIDTAGQAWGSFYQSNPPQHWGEVKIEDVQQAMRKAYTDYKSENYSIPTYKNILDVCNEEHVVKLMNERLNQVL